MMGMGMMGMPPGMMGMGPGGMGPGMMGGPSRPGMMGPPMPPGGKFSPPSPHLVAVPLCICSVGCLFTLPASVLKYHSHPGTIAGICHAIGQGYSQAL